jgi:F-type H+-transporting ATPase subunit a
MHEFLWITKLCNEYLAAPANAVRSILGVPAADPTHAWTNYMAMELLVVLILLLIPLILRTRLSIEKPGKFQQVFELIYEFLDGMSHDIVGHDNRRYVPLFGTLFLFILISNLIGLVPGNESPTMFAPVPLGCAMITFLYYNFHGFRVQGPIHYLKHFAGPLWWLAWFMFPLELISHMVRPVSLTIRLFANMVAGEKVTIGFMSLVPALVPVIFMALHVFVAFLQAFIFTVLTMAYVGGAVEHAEEH